MSSSRRAVVELLFGGLAAVAGVLSWLGARSWVAVAPVADGEPGTTSVSYYPPMLVLALMAFTVAGVLLVLGVARWRRRAMSITSDSYTP